VAAADALELLAHNALTAVTARLLAATTGPASAATDPRQARSAAVEVQANKHIQRQKRRRMNRARGIGYNLDGYTLKGDCSCEKGVGRHLYRHAVVEGLGQHRMVPFSSYPIIPFPKQLSLHVNTKLLHPST